MVELKKEGKESLDHFIPRTYVTANIDNTIVYFMEKYGMNKSNAIRHILNNGIQFIAMFGDGFEQDSEPGKKII